MKLAISYELVGTGWAKCTISDETSRCEITASYLSDTFGKLVLAAFAVLSGYRGVTFGFDEEPGEYRWVIRSVDINEIDIELREFEELWGNRSDPDGKLLFATRCRPVVFAKAVCSAARKMKDELGESGYLEQWSEHEWPARQLDLLEEKLALPHNAE